MELLKKQIEELREEMIHQGMTAGFSDDKTIELSEELDKLIEKAQKKKVYV